MKTTPSVQRPPLSLRVILSSLSLGFVIGILLIFVAVSFAALIFSGELDHFVSRGVGILLFGALVIGVVVALTTSIAGVIGTLQDPPNVILAVVAATPGVLFYLSARNLKHMDADDPQLAVAFHRLIAGILGEKLAQTSSTVRALQS